METRNLRLLAAGLLIVVIIVTSTSAPTPVTAASGPPTVLPGHVLSALGTASRIGDVPTGGSATLTIALRPQAPDALDRALSQARSAPLAAALSQDDVANVVGPSQATVSQVADYFRANGFTVASVERDRLSLRVTGSFDQIQKTLGVSLGIYRDRAGHTFRATSGEPSVPASVAGAIQAIFGLDTYPALKRLYQQRSPIPGSYTPSDIRTAYNVNSLLSMSLNGSGQTIGIVGCDTFTTSDIQGFNSTYGLPASTVTQVTVDLGPLGNQAETTLDLEWSHAIAPNAALYFYGFSDDPTNPCSFTSFLDAINRVKADNIASVVSISLGACEQTYVTDNILSAMETAFGAAALQGQGVVVASGDQGAFACTDSVGNPTVGVSYPASSAFVTAVGGTRLNLNADSTYASESAWGDTCTGDTGPVACGTGGGISGAISEPSWQSGASVPILPTGGKRGVPDVALDADPSTGYEIYWTDSSCPNPLCSGFGGTSIATPEWAGFAAIANQIAKRRLGQITPLLYSSSVLAARPYIYHDVTTGSDGSGTDSVYPALTGWDFTTGWGTANACHVVMAITNAAPASAFSGTSPVSGATVTTHQLFLPIVFQNGWNC